MFKHYKKVYVEEDLPEACLGCIFMGVDNKLWAGKELGYISTQWCDINGEHLEERWRDKRDDKCPLHKLLNEPTYNTPSIEEVLDAKGVERAVKDTAKDIACKAKEKRDEYNKKSLDYRKKNCTEREYYYIGKESAMEEVITFCKGYGVEVVE